MKHFLIIVALVVVIGGGWYVVQNYLADNKDQETLSVEKSFEDVLEAKDYALFSIYFSDSVHLTLENSGFGGDDLTPIEAGDFLRNKMELTDEWRASLPVGAEPDEVSLSNSLFNFTSTTEFLTEKQSVIEDSYNSLYSSRGGCQDVIFGINNGYGKIENADGLLILCRDASHKVNVIIQTSLRVLEQRTAGVQI